MLRLVRRYPVVVATLVVGVAVVALDLAGARPAGQILATAYVAAVIVWTSVDMVRSLLRGHFGLDILAVVAMVATLLVGEYLAALIIVLMLSGGEALEDYASRRAKHELTALLERAPQRAHVLTDHGVNGENTVDVDVADVRVGALLLVRPAEVVPVDGELLVAEASFDQPIIDENAVADLHVAAEPLVGGGELAARRVLAGDEHDVLTVLHLARRGEIADADARSLQVAEDGDRASQLGGGRAHQLDRLGVLLVRAVGEVEAGDVQPRLHETAQRLA